MSKRRKAGDRVWKKPMAGFVGEASFATIEREGAPEGCLLDCGDPDCVEWANVRTDDGAYAYHVSECEMLDCEPWPSTSR